DFAVETDAGRFQAFSEPAVGYAISADGGVQSLNPKHAKIAFTCLSIPIGPILAFHRRVFGVTEKFRATTAITFRFSQNPPSPFATGRGICCSRHLVIPRILVRVLLSAHCSYIIGSARPRALINGNLFRRCEDLSTRHAPGRGK